MLQVDRAVQGHFIQSGRHDQSHPLLGFRSERAEGLPGRALILI